MASYTRSTTVDSAPAGDTVKQAVIDLDTDLTGLVAAYNVHDPATTGVHGVGAATLVGTSMTQTLTLKTISGGTLTGSITASGATISSPTITGGTSTNMSLTTPTLTSPTLTGTVTASGATLSSPTITGGSSTNMTLTTPTITGGTSTNLALTTPTLTTPTLTGTITNTNGTITGGTISGATLTGTITATNATLASPSITGGTATNMTLVTPALGTPSAGVLSSCTAATDSARGVVELATTTEVQTGTSTTLAVTPAGVNSVVFQAAKGQMIDAVYGIITPANIRLFLVFDQTGAVSTITERSTIGGVTTHVTTLRDASLNAINASTCTPGVSGLAPYLTFDATHTWNTPDAADLSFALTAMSVVVLINPTLADNCDICSKLDLTTGSELREYMVYLPSTGGMTLRLYDETENGYIGRTAPTASVAANTWQSVAYTYDGGTSATGLAIYCNGLQVDDTTADSGTFNSMRDTAALVGGYVISTASAKYRHFLGKQSVLILVAEELTAIQVARLDAVLRGYAGVTL